MSDGPFFSVDEYPALAPLTAAWREVAAEALGGMPHMQHMNDRRVGPTDWSVLPFRVETDDRRVASEELLASNRALAPVTVRLVEALGDVEAFAFSSLAAGATISEHRHHRPFVTAALCLSGGEDAQIRVGSETRRFADGEWVIFDYTQPHEVVNSGTEPRVVLLVLMAPISPRES